MKKPIELLNSTNHSEDKKIFHISRYRIPYETSSFDYDKSSKNVIVYFAAWSKYYVKYAYLSLYSIIRNTDANEFDIKIITSDSIESYVRTIFEPVLGAEGIISHPHPYKYDIMTLPQLRGKEKVCLIDADGFIFSKQKSTVFKDIFYSEEKIIMGKETYAVPREILKHRRHILNGCESILNQEWLNGSWYLAGLSMYSTYLFGEAFNQYAQKFRDMGVVDDEAVILNYFNGSIEIKDMNEIIKLKMGEAGTSYINGEDEDSCIFAHPVLGDFCYNPMINDFFAFVHKHS